MADLKKKDDKYRPSSTKARRNRRAYNDYELKICERRRDAYENRQCKNERSKKKVASDTVSGKNLDINEFKRGNVELPKTVKK